MYDISKLMWACYYYISFKVCLDIKIRGIKMSREDSLDNTLNIDTSLLMDEIKENERYFFGSTDYVTQDIILDMLDISENDVFVDIGCGLGKVIYYVNHKVGCKTIGVEGDDRIFRKLKENHSGYKKKNSGKSGGNVLVLGSTGAEVNILNRKIEDIDSIYDEILKNHVFEDKDSLYFYFFNPFSVEVLKSFVAKLVEEAGMNRFGSKKIELVFYYLTPEYQMALREFPLKLEQISKLNDYYKDEFEKCCIYSLR